MESKQFPLRWGRLLFLGWSISIFQVEGGGLGQKNFEKELKTNTLKNKIQ